MRDGVYTTYGRMELPEGGFNDGGYNSAVRPGGLGAFLTLAGMMIWMTISGFTRRMRRRACTD